MTLTEIALPIAAAGVVHLAAVGVGALAADAALARALGGAGRGERAFFRSLVGTVALGLVAFALAAAGALHAKLVAAIAVAGALGGAIRIARDSRPPEPGPRWSWIPVVAAAMIVLAAVPATAYPVLTNDENAHQLMLPREYLERGGFAGLGWSLYANVPNLVNLLYVFPSALGEPGAARGLGVGFVAWTIWALSHAGLRHGGALGAVLAPLLYLSGPNVLFHVGLANPEPTIGFFLLAAALAFERWWTARDVRLLAVAGLGCGAALASKYTAWPYAGALLAVVAVAVFRSSIPGRARAIAVAALWAPAALVVAPVLVRSAVITGNPLFPGLYGLFGGASWSATQSMQLARSLSAAGGVDKTFVDALLLPFRLVADTGERFFCPSFSAALMIAFVAALLLPRAWGGVGAWLHAAALVGFAGWAVTIQTGRFLVAWVPVLTLCAIRAASMLEPRSVALGIAGAATITLGAVQVADQPLPRRPVLDVFTTPHRELLARNYRFDETERLNRTLPHDAKVLGLWENLLYFLDRDYESDSENVAPSALARLREAGDPDAFARTLLEDGITHVLIDPRHFELYADPARRRFFVDGRVLTEAGFERDLELLAAFDRRWLEPLEWKGEWRLYRLRTAPRP